jgi:hypothetical protein
MKKILTIISVLGLFASAVNAQTYAAQSVTVTNAIAASSTENLNQVIDCRKQKDVAIQISFKMSSSGTGNQTFVFDRSVDGSTWNSLAADKTTVVVAATGATLSTTVTNLNTYGAGFLRLVSWQNGQAGQYATNTSVKYGIKIAAP